MISEIRGKVLARLCPLSLYLLFKQLTASWEDWKDVAAGGRKCQLVQIVAAAEAARGRSRIRV